MDSARAVFGSMLPALLEAWEERPLADPVSVLRFADVVWVWACAGAAMLPAMRAIVTAMGVAIFAALGVSTVYLSEGATVGGGFHSPSSSSIGTFLSLSTCEKLSHNTCHINIV